MRIGRVILPTGISLAIHAALLGLVALATWTVVRPAPRQMPTVELSLDGPREIPREAPPPVTPQPDQPVPEAPSISRLAESLALPEPARVAVAAPIITPRTDASKPTEIRIAPGAGAAGPASFAGVTSRRASSVVFVVDCSGSMVSAMSIVLEELGRSLERLAPDQRFAIVPFRGADSADAPATFPTKLALVPATDSNLREARAFLRTIAPGGRSDPLAGLGPALTLKPEAIFFLARSIPRTEDTWGPGEQAIMAELDRLNPVYPRKNGTSARASQISAIQFLQPDPTGIMQSIGLAHGRGSSGYTVLTLEQLGRAELSPAPSARQLAADLDRASAMLAELSRDATDAAVLVGLPTDDQIKRTRRAAMDAMNLVDQAAAMLGISEDGAGGAGGLMGEGSGGDDPRIVLLGARAALLLAASDPSHEFRASLLERAARALTLLDGDAISDGSTRAMAVSTWALAHGLQRDPPAPEVRERLAEILKTEPALASSSLELTLALLFVERGQGASVPAIDWNRPPFVASDGRSGQSPTDPGAALLSCDAIARVSRMPGEAASAAASAPFDAPYAAFLAIDVLTPTSPEREAIVRERLGRLRALPPARDGGEPLEQIGAALASASSMASDQSMESVEAFEAELARLLEMAPPLGVELVLEAAVALLDRKDASVGGLRLASRLAAIAGNAASTHAAHQRATEACMIALVRLVERAPSDTTIESLIELVGSSDATNAAPSTRDAAALIAASALIETGREPTWPDARAYDLLALVSEVVPARETAARLAERLDARLAMLAMRDGDVDRHVVSMRRSVELSRSLGREPSVKTLDAIATTLVDLGAPEAVEACRELLAHPRVMSLERGQVGAEILLARALANAGDDAGALVVLVPLAQSMPEPGPVPPEQFWQVWTMTLESMSRAEPARAQELHGHITRLGLIDESLGAEPWAGRIRALAKP